MFLNRTILNLVRLHYANALFYPSGLAGEAGGCASGGRDGTGAFFQFAHSPDPDFFVEGENLTPLCAFAEKFNSLGNIPSE